MPSSAPRSKRATQDKYFTVQQANAMLPLVRAIAGDIAELSRVVQDRHVRLRELRGERELTADDPYTAELAEIERQQQRDTAQLRSYAEELRQLGIIPRGGPEGLVDFPTRIDGREALLCWRIDEPEVLFWHYEDEGFAGRKPLTAESVAGGEGTESFEL